MFHIYLNHSYRLKKKKNQCGRYQILRNFHPDTKLFSEASMIFDWM